MNTKHTPGLWKVSTHIVTDLKNGNHLNLAIDAKDEMRDYVCYVSAFDGMPAEANAKLIAAAPELLKEMLRYLPVLEWVETMPEIWNRATKGTGIATLNGYRNAIEKATL